MQGREQRKARVEATKEPARPRSIPRILWFDKARARNAEISWTANKVFLTPPPLSCSSASVSPTVATHRGPAARQSELSFQTDNPI